MDKTLLFDKVSFGYKKNDRVLEGVSFSLQEGSVTALMGINGAGKSTITWLASRILEPDDGKIQWWGRSSSDWDKNIKKRIGLLASADPLFDFLTIDDHLAYVGKLYGIDKTELRKQTQQLKSVFGLDEFQGRLINTLSTGNRRKVGIVTTLLHSPKLLIWDEPFNALDPIASLRLKELIKKLKHEGRTLLMTSQVIEPVEQVCDKFLLLDGKKILFDKAVADLGDIKEQYGVHSLESLIYKIGTAKNFNHD